MRTGTPSFSRYQLIAELDHGGMADVFLAMAKGPGGFSKLHVVKCMRHSLEIEPSLVDMFLDEGRLAARLNHPNIVQTFEVGEDDGRHFIAMEYLEGQSLTKVLRAHERQRGAPLPRHVHLRILTEAMRGLHYAHELTDFDGTPLDIIHRDVSPQNVFLTYAGAVKLLDFGIAKTTIASSTTEAGTFKGKASYVAPEQALNESCDCRADVFAMGMLLWTAAVGRPMWYAESDVQRLTAILTSKLRMPREVDPAVPAELDAIIRKALYRNPDYRYRSMSELRLAVERYLSLNEPESTADQRAELVTQLFAGERRIVEDMISAHVAKIDRGNEPPPLRLSSPPPSLSSVAAASTDDVAPGGDDSSPSPTLLAPRIPSFVPVARPSPSPSLRPGGHGSRLRRALDPRVVVPIALILGAVVLSAGVLRRRYEPSRELPSAALARPPAPIEPSIVSPPIVSPRAVVAAVEPPSVSPSAVTTPVAPPVRMPEVASPSAPKGTPVVPAMAPAPRWVSAPPRPSVVAAPAPIAKETRATHPPPMASVLPTSPRSTRGKAEILDVDTVFGRR